ncbi:MAG TPA: hypothetical protein VHT51_11680, partial [Micropepsaceae bacterium]|nr:hypothetical protein [Micropepsaceae bacterium]
MSNVAKAANRDLWKAPRQRASRAVAAAILMVIAAAAFAHAQSPSQDRAAASNGIPDLASAQFAWLVLGVDWLDPPPG